MEQPDPAINRSVTLPEQRELLERLASVSREVSLIKGVYLELVARAAGVPISSFAAAQLLRGIVVRFKELPFDPVEETGISPDRHAELDRVLGPQWLNAMLRDDPVAEQDAQQLWQHALIQDQSE